MNRRMNRTFLAVLLVIAAPLLTAQDADVVYLEGWPEVRSGSARQNLDFGDPVRPGDSVVTGRRDFVELDQAGNSILVSPDTVFTIREIETDGRRETVLTNTVGSVSYRMRTLAGREQRVATGTVVAGVRGTEFTVFAASDGTSLFGVDTGLISVESAGVAVDVATGEAVEVRAGEPPGDVMRWIGPALDFRDWNRDQIDRFLEEPVNGLQRLAERLGTFAESSGTMYTLWEEQMKDVEDARTEAVRIREEVGEDEFIQYREEVLNPIIRNTRSSIFNARSYALSGLSLRRHILSRLYVEMKTQFWNDLDNPVFVEFNEVYNRTLAEFETNLVPRLVPADI
jgi:hypothetical protein